MKSIKMILRRKIFRSVAPLICMALIGIGAAGCGSNGGTGSNQKTPTSAKSGGTAF